VLESIHPSSCLKRGGRTWVRGVTPRRNALESDWISPTQRKNAVAQNDDRQNLSKNPKDYYEKGSLNEPKKGGAGNPVSTRRDSQGTSCVEGKQTRPANRAGNPALFSKKRTPAC